MGLGVSTLNATGRTCTVATRNSLGGDRDPLGTPGRQVQEPDPCPSVMESAVRW